MQKNSVNKVLLVGRIGQKPELKYLPNQTALTNISVATSESFKGADGTNQDKTEWHRIVIFGKTAEFVANYLDKGNLIYVDGRLQTRSWENRDGVKMSTTEIVAQTVTPLGSKPQSDGGRDSVSQQSSTPKPASNPFGGGEDKDEVPF